MDYTKFNDVLEQYIAEREQAEYERGRSDERKKWQEADRLEK